MPSTGTRKKKSTAGRKTTRKKTPSAKKRQKQAYNRELVTEITILITLAVSVLLVISNFDIGGKVGTVISQFFFGLFGWMAYLFPIVLFMGTAFAIANYDNDLMSRLSEGRYGKRILYLLFTAQNRRRNHRWCNSKVFMCFLWYCRCLCADVYFSDHLCDHYHAAYGSCAIKENR